MTGFYPDYKRKLFIIPEISFSVDNIVKISLKDSEDETVYNFDIDLNKVEVTFPENKNETIKINEKSGLIMKYPSASLYEDKEFLKTDKEHYYQLILKCVDKIY